MEITLIRLKMHGFPLMIRTFRGELGYSQWICPFAWKKFCYQYQRLISLGAVRNNMSIKLPRDCFKVTWGSLDVTSDKDMSLKQSGWHRNLRRTNAGTNAVIDIMELWGGLWLWSFLGDVVVVYQLSPKRQYDCPWSILTYWWESFQANPEG